MMIESLWNLEDYAGSLSWTEIAIHEAIEARDKKSSTVSAEENVEKVSYKLSIGYRNVVATEGH